MLLTVMLVRRSKEPQIGKYELSGAGARLIRYPHPRSSTCPCVSYVSSERKNRGYSRCMSDDIIPPGENASTNGKTIERAHSWMPETDAERAAIRDQMEKILSSSLFRQSKRYPALFRYIVENTLSGRTDRLKERTLGVEVFLRDPDYDTNLDPVVRTSAGEIRKRLAQYYLQAGDEIRIDLPSGCYVAEFHPPDAVQMPAAAAFPLRTARPAWLPYGLAAIVFSALLVLTFARMKAPSPLDRFWAPVFDSPDPVLLCLGGPKGATPITRLQERS